MPRVTKAELKVIADAAAERIRQFGPTAALPIPGNPPPPLKQGDGDAEARLDPAGEGGHDVALDAAAFMLLWRYCESHALHLHNNPSPHARAFEAAFLRATKAFRSASGQEMEPRPIEGKKWRVKHDVAPPKQNTLRDVVKHDAARAIKKAWGKK